MSAYWNSMDVATRRVVWASVTASMLAAGLLL